MRLGSKETRNSKENRKIKLKKPVSLDKVEKKKVEHGLEGNIQSGLRSFFFFFFNFNF